MPIGDIHWAQLPPTDGHEQDGRRPVILFQDDGYAGSLPTVYIIPLSSSWAARRFPGTVPILASPLNGLAYNSVALVFQIRALDRRRLLGQIGKAEPRVITEIYIALDRVTGRNRLLPTTTQQPPQPMAPP